MSKLLGLRPLGARLPESNLRKLAQEAGSREESWARRENVAGGELYECLHGDLHERILTEFRKEYVRIYTHLRGLAAHGQYRGRPYAIGRQVKTSASLKSMYELHVCSKRLPVNIKRGVRRSYPVPFPGLRNPTPTQQA